MAYLGNKHGPRESEIVDRLGAEYFGVSESDLRADVEWFEDEEIRSEVKPVRCDEDGRYYILFSGPKNTTQRFYLDEHGYALTGTIETQTSAA